MILILFGVPGVGKGTLAALLEKEFNIPHISSGNILRELVSNDIAGEDLKSLIHKGELVPDLLVYKLVGDRLKNKDCEKGFILDGFPRTIAQAEFLDKLLIHQNRKINKVIYFTAEESTIITRVGGRRICENCDQIYHLKNIMPKKEGICNKCGGKLIQREDDTPHVIKHRIKIYRQQTEPVIDFYKKENVLVEIDTEKPIPEIFKATLAVIK